MGVTSQGMAAIVKTAGNKDVHVILRGGSSGPNFAAEHVNAALDKIRKTRPDAFPSLMVDCSHGNSSKNHKNQPKVAKVVGDQLREGEKAIIGVMVESNIGEGNQKVPAEGPAALQRGVSITDACIGWEDTVAVLEDLADAVRTRRQVNSS
jgi:3-deoxy-7-phosphoheptulonate synthase